MQNVMNLTVRRNRAPWNMAGFDVSGCETVVEALGVSGMDWNVTTEPALCRDGNGSAFPVDNQFLTVRDDLQLDDPNRVLGCVKGRYTPISNREALGIADAVKSQGGIQFDRAGTIRNGKTVYIVAEMPEGATVRDDTVAQYLIIKTSHDGTGAAPISSTRLRAMDVPSPVPPYFWVID